MSYQNGDEIDIVTCAQTALTTYKAATRANDNIGGYVDDAIGDILKDQTDVSKGIKPRLAVLQQYMRPFRSGDFGIMAARPDQGKTSLICSELTYMASQTDQPILWCNNEGRGRNIYPRLYQAALNLTYPEMLELNRKGTLVKEYLKAIKSDDPFKIRIKDIHDFTIGQVERVIEEIKPSIVVYDMIDNIKGFGSMARTDLALEEMYKYCRTLAVTYDHIGFATSQISAEGDQLCYPTQTMLKDSKTGKQGACDFILMMGQNKDAGPNQRFIGLPKNKLMLAGKQKDPQTEVYFDAARCRFKDLQAMTQ
jgi:replicative DNA helicase